MSSKALENSVRQGIVNDESVARMPGLTATTNEPALRAAQTMNTSDVVVYFGNVGNQHLAKTFTDIERCTGLVRGGAGTVQESVIDARINEISTLGLNHVGKHPDVPEGYISSLEAHSAGRAVAGTIFNGAVTYMLAKIVADEERLAQSGITGQLEHLTFGESVTKNLGDKPVTVPLAGDWR